MSAPVFYLVSCTKEKAALPTEARLMYTSDWFKKARAYVESTGCRWNILSALHSALSPSRVIEPYDFTLNQPNDPNNRCRRQVWSNIIADRMALQLFHGSHIVIFAGCEYREFLVPALRSKGFTVEVPLAGMGIGQQKRWFLQNTPAANGKEQLSLCFNL